MRETNSGEFRSDLTGLRSADGHLIVQTAFLGDLLLSIPLINEIKTLGDPVTLLCRKGLGAFFRDAKLVDHVIEVDKSKPDSWKSARESLSGKDFGLIVCPHESFRSATFVARLKAKKKIGYRRFFNGFIFNDRIERPLHLPEVLRQLALLQPIDAKWEETVDTFAKTQELAGGQTRAGEMVPIPAGTEMIVSRLGQLREGWQGERSLSVLNDVSPPVLEIARELEIEKRALVVLAPGSVWATKMWTSSHYAEVARHYVAQGMAVALTGSPDEIKICESIASEAPGSKVVAGRTGLYASAELLALADLVVCNDSGAMHLAATSGAPTVSVFGPTVLEFGYRPWSHNARVVQTMPGSLGCRPCGKHGAKKCPIGTHVCMKDIKPDVIIEAARQLHLK